MPNQPAKIIFDFVIEKTVGELPARQATLYRALAVVIGDEKAAVTLNSLAADCESVDAKQHQLAIELESRDGNDGTDPTSDRDGRAGK